MQQEQYKVHLESFEGPLDLLLHLIEKNRIDIYDIPIALLTEQYMDYLAKFKKFNIEVASEFLVMAATLLQIKSKILLPDTKVEEINEDDTDEVDPRKELVERLLEYRRYKEVSSILGEMADEAGKRFFREASNLPTKHLPPKGLDVKLLWQAFQNVLESQIENEPLVANVAREKYTIEDKIISLLALLKQHGGNICFNTVFQYSEHKISKSELITTFLAMLELIKIKSVFRLSGISDIIILKNDNLNTTIKDILDNNLLEDSEEKINSRAIIFNNIESRKISAVSDNLKKLKVQRPLLATVTETSINWDLKNLLYNLQEEAISLNSSKVSIHKNS